MPVASCSGFSNHQVMNKQRPNDVSDGSRTRQFRSGLGGTRAEVQAFVASLKGRSAAEAMGVMARSRLMQAMVISVVVQGIALLVLTVPYWLGSDGDATAGTTITVPAVSSGADQEQPAAAADDPAPAAPAPAPTTPQTTPATTPETADAPASAAPRSEENPQDRRAPSMDTMDFDLMLD